MGLMAAFLTALLGFAATSSSMDELSSTDMLPVSFVCLAFPFRPVMGLAAAFLTAPFGFAATSSMDEISSTERQLSMNKQSSMDESPSPLLKHPLGCIEPS